MTDTVVKGRKPDGAFRAPKTYEGERRCAYDGCDTLLSRYNRREWCFAHAPVKYPRLRGRVVADGG